jgi:S1-C subfamily serine protease
LDGVLPPGSIIVAVMDRSIGDLDAFFGRVNSYDLRPQYGVRITFIRPDGEQDQTIILLR